MTKSKSFEVMLQSNGDVTVRRCTRRNNSRYRAGRPCCWILLFLRQPPIALTVDVQKLHQKVCQRWDLFRGKVMNLLFLAK